MPRAEISSQAAEILVLGRLEALALSGATAREVERELLAIDEKRLFGRALDGALDRLVNRGEVSVEGPLESRVYVIQEKGRARLREGRPPPRGLSSRSS